MMNVLSLFYRDIVSERLCVYLTKNAKESCRLFAAVKQYPYLGQIFWINEPIPTRDEFYGLPIITSDSTVPVLPVMLSEPALPTEPKIFAPEGLNFEHLYPIQGLLQPHDINFTQISLVKACGNYACNSSHTLDQRKACFGQETKKPESQVLKFRLNSKAALNIQNADYLSKTFTMHFIDRRYLEVRHNYWFINSMSFRY